MKKIFKLFIILSCSLLCGCQKDYVADSVISTENETDTETVTESTEEKLPRDVDIMSTEKPFVSIDNVDYTLPTNIQTFLDDGWVLDNPDSKQELIEFDEFYSFCVTKDDMELILCVHNPYRDAQTIFDLEIYSINALGAFMHYGNLSVGCSKDVVMESLGKQEDGPILFYYFRDVEHDVKYNLWFYIDDYGKVDRLEFSRWDKYNI